MGEVPLLYHTKCNTDTQLTKIFFVFFCCCVLALHDIRSTHTRICLSLTALVRNICIVCCPSSMLCVLCVCDRTKSTLYLLVEPLMLFFSHNRRRRRVCVRISYRSRSTTSSTSVPICLSLTLPHTLCLQAIPLLVAQPYIAPSIAWTYEYNKYRKEKEKKNTYALIS